MQDSRGGRLMADLKPAPPDDSPGAQASGPVSILTIIGPGTLGCSLAAWAARKGLQVRLAGRNQEHAQRARERVLEQWQDAIRRGHMSPSEFETAPSLLEASPTWEKALEGADIMLEALPEDMGLKAASWKRIHQAATPATLRFTGSSSLPVATLAASIQAVGELLGFHLFVPVDRMRLVELVVPEEVSEALVLRATGFAAALEHSVVRVKDQPGYAASRMALAQGLEAMRLLEAGVATAEGLDALMVKGYGHRIGPLALSDLIGLDLRLTIAEGIFQTQGDPRFEPPAILKDLVAKGFTGRKVGRGFLDWTSRKGDP